MSDKECGFCNGSGTGMDIYEPCPYCSPPEISSKIEAEMELLGECLKEEIVKLNNKTNMRKYHREIKPGVWIDVYDVLSAFEVTCPAVQHALKKLLAAGNRGYKDEADDLKEAIVSINRGIELQQEKHERKSD